MQMTAANFITIPVGMISDYLYPKDNSFFVHSIFKEINFLQHIKDFGYSLSESNKILFFIDFFIQLKILKINLKRYFIVLNIKISYFIRFCFYLDGTELYRNCIDVNLHEREL